MIKNKNTANVFAICSILLWCFSGLCFPETLSITLIPASILIAAGSLYVKRAIKST